MRQVLCRAGGGPLTRPLNQVPKYSKLYPDLSYTRQKGTFSPRVTMNKYTVQATIK